MIAKALAWIGVVGAVVTALGLVVPLVSDFWAWVGVTTPTIYINFFLAPALMVFILLGVAGRHRVREGRRPPPGGAPHP